MDQTLGERCLEVAMKMVGVKEQPPRSNTGPEVKEFLAPCVRGDKNIKLGLTASNWCMAFASWCQDQALHPNEHPAHGYRAGVVEAVADARDPHGKWEGKWHPIKDVRNGKWQPKPGDLAIYDRSDPKRPETSWWRHVNRVVSFNRKEGTFQTIGGNEADQVRIGEQTITKATLLGFVAYPQPKEPAVKEMLTPEERTQIANLVYLTIDGMMRDSIWNAPIDEEDTDPGVS